jgi:hypothetical protein
MRIKIGEEKYVYSPMAEYYCPINVTPRRQQAVTSNTKHTFTNYPATGGRDQPPRIMYVPHRFEAIHAERFPFSENLGKLGTRGRGLVTQ